MKNQFVRFCMLLCISIPLGTAWGVTLTEVELKELSSSGKSIVVDQGEMDDYKQGDYARFYVQKGTLNEPVVFLVAEGELIKATPRKSYWLMRNIHIPEGMKNQTKLLLLTSRTVLNGRPLKMKVRQRVASKDEYQDVDDFLAENKENVPSRLIRYQDNYDKSEELFDKDEVPEADVELARINSFRDKSQTYYSEEYGDLTAQKYFIGNKEVRLGDVKRAEDKKLFDSMADGYQNHVANLKYGVKEFYRDNAKEEGMHEFNKSLTIKSTYDQAREDKKYKEVISPRAIAKMERDGENWSADMDSASLRKYFISTGLEREARRRELALNELDGNEVMLHYSGSMIDQSTDADPNYRGLGYNLGIGYDLHLSRTSPDLKKWSLQFFLERGVVNTDIGGQNARSEEGFWGAYVNYYFVNNPLTLNSFIYLAGVGLKVGSSDITSPEMENEYNYEVLTLPSLQLMGKYRFRTGDLAEDTVNVGASANFGVNLDFKNYSTQDNLEDNINGKFSNMDLKYYLGMSVYF